MSLRRIWGKLLGGIGVDLPSQISNPGSSNTLWNQSGELMLGADALAKNVFDQVNQSVTDANSANVTITTDPGDAWLFFGQAEYEEEFGDTFVYDSKGLIISGIIIVQTQLRWVSTGMLRKEPAATWSIASTTLTWTPGFSVGTGDNSDTQIFAVRLA